jgi:hypothetical protein
MKGNGSETNCATEALNIQRNLARRVPVMVIVTYDSDGAALHHTISDNQNVNSEYYRKFLETFASSRATKATTFQYRYSTTYDAQKCTLTCDKTWDWASGIVEVGTSNIFPTFQT